MKLRMLEPPGFIEIHTWSNVFGIFGGHDIFGYQNSVRAREHAKRVEETNELWSTPSGTAYPAWFWQQVPVKSESSRGQTVKQLFANSQQLDDHCSMSASTASGEGQLASVFLLSRRPALGLLEGRMISTHTGDWFESRSPSFLINLQKGGGTAGALRKRSCFRFRSQGYRENKIRTRNEKDVELLCRSAEAYVRRAAQARVT
jgi:hypothetical protein